MSEYERFHDLGIGAAIVKTSRTMLRALAI
jgi:hypothetical protein